jgi:hypothetical protein
MGEFVIGLGFGLLCAGLAWLLSWPKDGLMVPVILLGVVLAGLGMAAQPRNKNEHH